LAKPCNSNFSLLTKNEDIKESDRDSAYAELNKHRFLTFNQNLCKNNDTMEKNNHNSNEICQQ
jgi:hypothetical protein